MEKGGFITRGRMFLTYFQVLDKTTDKLFTEKSKNIMTV